MVYKKTFEELSKNELYELLRLRIEVFVIEQNCPYQECDNLDQQALHYYMKAGDQIIAYLRIIPSTNNVVKIGRVVVKQSNRMTGLGIQIMQEAIQDCKKQFPHSTLKISAQQYLDGFYTNLGFNSTGKKYLEDGIPHQEMVMALS